MVTPPTISIITVVRNAADLLRRTISSIEAQSYPHIQYIVIDGASDDGTVDVIREHADTIGYWVSEPDDGLYDAMNKGMHAATGDYLWFLNAGDEIYAPDTVEKMIGSADKPDIYYGETLLIDDEGAELGTRSELNRNKLPETLSWKDMAWGMVVCHQSFVVRREIAPLYDTAHPYAADIDWVIKCLKAAANVVNTQMLLSRFLVGGYSKRNIIKSIADRYYVYRTHFGFFRNIVNHLVISARVAVWNTKRMLADRCR